MFAALLVSVSASAADGPYSVALHADVAPGEKPTVVVTAHQPLATIALSVTRAADGKSFSVKHGALAAGQSASLPFGDGQAGHAAWQGTLEILVDGAPGPVRQTLSLTTNGAATLHIGYSRDRLDLVKRTLQFTLSAPAQSAQLTVTGDDGTVGHANATYHGERAGSWLDIAWPAQTGTVLSLELRADAQNGASSVLKLTPWSVEVAHAEVLFATKSATIAPTEETKLDDSRARIVETLTKVHHSDPTLPVHLYVVGHTDTVGATADNQRLSEARAKAIARWFAAHAVTIPIEFTGVGESALAVPTPDETDEPKNRRVDYILGLEEPIIPAATTHWKR